MVHKTATAAFVLILGWTAVGAPAQARPKARRHRRRPPVDASLRDSLAPLPPATSYTPSLPQELRPLSDDPALFPVLADGAQKAPEPVEGPWIVRYDLTSSDPMGPPTVNNYLDSMMETGRKKPGLVSVGDGLSRIVLTPIVTTVRASGPKDALRRVAFCPFVCAIGAVTGTGQVAFGLLKTATVDVWRVFKPKKS